MIPMLYLKYNKSAVYRFYQEQTCRDRFSHTYNSSFYICNTETTIKKSRQTHFANNKKNKLSYVHNWKSAPAIMQPHICR